MKPVAWLSSTSSVAWWRSASAQISGSGASVPSIEKTPSVTISRKRQVAASRSFASRSAMSAFLYTKRFALQSLTPSMIEAWLSWSVTIASSAPRSGSKTPPFASKQAAYRIASCMPRKAAIFRSSSRCSACVPQMKRTLDIP